MTQARILPGGTSASFSAASNCDMTFLKRDLGLEYRYRLAADPDAGQGFAAEFKLDLDPPGPRQRVPLNAGKVRALAAARDEAQLRQIGPEQPVGVTADRILGDAERRAEHTRLGQMVRGARREGEDEVTGRADLRRQRREPCEVGFQMLEGFGPAHSDQQPRAYRTDDTQRCAGVETLGGERQRIEHRESLAVVELAAHGRGAAANRDAAIRVAALYLDVDDPGLGPLSLPARRVVPARQHVLRGHGGVAHEPGLAARREEARPHRVIRAVRGEDEGGLGVVELARDGEHLRLGERIGIQHHPGRVSGEGFAGERVNLMNLDLTRHLSPPAVSALAGNSSPGRDHSRSRLEAVRAILTPRSSEATRMDIGVEISLYPLRSDFVPAIRAFIARLNDDPRLKVVTNSLSTQVFGAYEEVMEALRRELRTTFQSLEKGSDKAVFVMKVLGPLPPA